MMKHRTGTSSSYGPPDDAGERELAGRLDAGSKPGLVLLYAPHFEELAPAYVFAGAELIAGASRRTQVCVPEQAVSRHHARFSLEGGAGCSPTCAAASARF